MMELLTKPAQANPIPASIVKAIAKVMLGMKAVEKSQTNEHGRYKYASADDVYAALSIKMAEAGLVSLCLEDREPEIKKVERKDKNGNETVSQWMNVRYAFILATEQDTWADERAKRSLFIQITGPQTFQAAQSYAEKSWLRSMFKIATGDMDLDGLPQIDDGDETSKKGRKKAETISAPANGEKKPLPPIVERERSGFGSH